MKRLHWRMACAVLASAAGSLHGRMAVAQGTSLDPSASSPVAASPMVSSMPVPVPLFGSALPSVPGDPTTPTTGMSSQNSMFSSPFAAPFLYQSMIQASQPPWMSGSSATTGSTSTSTGSTSTGSSAGNYANRGLGVSTAQLGLLMMATQNYGGVGSGQLSGARPNPQARSQANARTATTQRRTRVQPGGLAAKYFNRVGGHTSFPQGYYRRQSRYFP